MPRKFSARLMLTEMVYDAGEKLKRHEPTEDIYRILKKKLLEMEKIEASNWLKLEWD